MKFKRVQVEYTKTIEVTVLCPATMADGEIAKFLSTYNDIDHWEEPDWESLVSKPEIVNIPAEECRTEKNARGRTVPVPALLREDLVVMSDDRKEMVDPIDATWWICDEEQVREEHRNEPNPDQIEMWSAKS